MLHVEKLFIYERKQKNKHRVCVIARGLALEPLNVARAITQRLLHASVHIYWFQREAPRYHATVGAWIGTHLTVQRHGWRAAVCRNKKKTHNHKQEPPKLPQLVLTGKLSPPSCRQSRLNLLHH